MTERPGFDYGKPFKYLLGYEDILFVYKISYMLNKISHIVYKISYIYQISNILI